MVIILATTLLLIMTFWLCGFKYLIMQLVNLAKILYDGVNYIIWNWWFVHCRVFTWKSMHSQSCWFSWWKNVIVSVCYVGGFIVVKLSSESNWYHMHVEVSKTLHALNSWWNVSYLIMWIGDYVRCENVKLCMLFYYICMPDENVDVEVNCWMN